MKPLNSWNNIPKSDNLDHLEFNKKKGIRFESNKTYLPRGLGRSYGDVCLNENGFLILNSENKEIISFDDKTGFIECEAGISINELLKILLPFGWFLPVVPGTSYVTVGGAIANDIHGKNHHKVGSFGNFVDEIHLLRSNGENLVCTRKNNNDYFKATIGGLGLTGLITKAKLKLLKINNEFITTQTVRYHSLEDFFCINDEMEISNEYTVSWVDIGFDNSDNIRGVYLAGNHSKNADYSPKKLRRSREINFKIPFPPYICLVNNFTINILNNSYYFLNKNTKEGIQHYRNYFFPLDILKNWNKAYGKKGFYQYQFVVPLKSAEVAISDVINILKKHNQRPALGVLKTFGNIKSEGLLSFPTQGVTLALDFQNKGVSTLNMLNELDKVINFFEGRLYPAKDARMTNESFLKSFPNYDQFEKFIDPLFSSSFIKRVIKN